MDDKHFGTVQREEVSKKWRKNGSGKREWEIGGKRDGGEGEIQV